MAKKSKKNKDKSEEVDIEEKIEYSEDSASASPDAETMENEADFELEDIEENIQDKLKKLKEELKKCKSERQEYLDGWQRSRADYANLKVEEEKKRTQITEFTKEDLLLSFLPILDSFDMAFANKEAWESVDKNWRTGVEHIYNQLLSVFKEQGVSEINETGISFDSELHQSIEIVDTKNKKEDGTLSEIVSKGYKVNGRILRPARVKVYKYNSA